MYIVTKATSDKNISRIHTINCPVGPRIDFSICDGTIDDAAKQLGIDKEQIQHCEVCKDHDGFASNFK